MSELERWDQRFAKSDYWFGTEPNAFLKSQAHLLKPGLKALTLADGEGRNGVWLAEQGLEVHSVDISPKGIAKAHALAAHRGVKLATVQADLATWIWPTNAYDVIVGIFFQIWFPPERARIFSGIKQALRPGGLLLMQNYRTDQLKYRTGGPSEIERLYTRALLEESFGDFSSVDIKEYDSTISEGTGHVGMSALIDLVARK
jgi:SAM-dependent methyltransferase